jgi:hypothetical protein
MPRGKNLKRLALHTQRQPRQFLDSRLPPHRPAPERHFLRRLYFLKSERSQYVCLGFYPDRGLRAFFEFGGARQAPVVLPPSLVPTLALHLPKLCVHRTRDEPYKCNEMLFRMQIVAETSAKVALDRGSIALRLPELEYLLLNLTTLAKQLAR